MKSTLGTSLTEVMIMMVILSMSIVGIYSLVNSGRELATLTDTRLMAMNIAREGVESVATLRDTFGLKGYESGACGVINAFFSINEEVLTGANPINCPQTDPTNPKKYILQDNKKLVIPDPTALEVCINEFGWYSQEYSIKNGSVDVCGVVGNKCPCVDTTILCGGNITQSCKTRFEREITFETCPSINTEYCINVISKVTWGIEDDEQLILSQILTPLD